MGSSLRSMMERCRLAARAMNRRFAAAVLLVAAAAVVNPLASVAQTCTISPANGDYGVVDVLGGASASTSASFTVSCTGTPGAKVVACVELSPGQSSGGHRRLASGSYRLVHEIYADAAHTVVWGSWGLSSTAYGSAGQTEILTLGGGGSASMTLTAYGATATNQQATAGPGSYVWTMTTAPSIEYGYYSGTSCPTGSIQAISGGSSWSATVNSNCNVAVTSVNFGSTGSFIASAIDTTGTINVQCTDGSPYSVGLDNGQHASGGQRRMQALAGQYVSYGLYTDSAYSLGWTTTSSSASCSGGTGTCALGTGTGATQPITIYAQIPPQNAPAPGNYADTVVVTVTF
jgi:spore coat protein U-like protein